MRDDFALTVGELKQYLTDKPDDAVVKLNVSGHVADAMGHTPLSVDNVVVLTGEELEDS